MFLISALILPNVGLSFLSILVYFVPAASRKVLKFQIYKNIFVGNSEVKAII